MKENKGSTQEEKRMLRSDTHINIKDSRDMTIRRMYLSGCTFSEISKEVGVSRQRVQQLVKNRQHPIRNHGRPRKGA